MINGHYLSKP